MMNINEEIVHHLKQLHMPTVRRCYEQIADRRAKNRSVMSNVFWNS